MRVLHVNKFASVVGGVETHMHHLAAEQANLGHQVGVFSAEDLDEDGFSSAPTTARGRFVSAAALFWSRQARMALDRRIAEWRPDIVHFHGIYHQLSPSVLTPPARRQIPSVMTLHDYKLAAPCYLLVRDGVECTLCVGRRLPLDAIRYKCVKGSAIGSATCAVEQLAHLPLYRRYVGAFIVPSRAAKDHLVKSRTVPSARTYVVPHGVECPIHFVPPDNCRPIVLFLGRLSPEKGVRPLLEAWDNAATNGWSLVVAGDGADRAELEARAGHRSDVWFAGHLQREQIRELLTTAGVVVSPSLFPETFGLSVAEAMAAAKPVLVSRIGNLPELVGDESCVIAPGNVQAWVDALNRAVRDADWRRVAGLRARRRIIAHFSVPAAVKATHLVYESAMAVPLALR